MKHEGWAERLRGSPEVFPLEIDPANERVELRHLTRRDYERASFLDGRLQTPVAGHVAFPDLAAATSGLSADCDFIFHVGHVGSTLLSRLLGVHPGVFGVREPQALRTLAQADLSGRPWSGPALEDRLGVFQRLYARTWTPSERAMVKATSLVSELGARLLSQAPGARAVLMTTAPEVYLATILGGPNSRTELTTAAPGRLARLHRRLGQAPWRAEVLSEGERAAMIWASEMTALWATALAHPNRTLWLDFEVFLQAPEISLSSILCFLGLAAEPAQVQQILSSGYLDRYSKAPEYAYGPDVRRDVISASRQEHAHEIRRGLQWLNAAAVHPAVAQALEPPDAA